MNFGSNLTILIQGPLNDISLSNISYYKSIGEVIISYWDADDKSILKKLSYENNKVKITKTPTTATANHGHFIFLKIIVL